MPEDMPDRMPEDLPDRMPEDMPDRMPNRMSEDMSDRMPEDVPVRTCINVMVGITRSKVIFFFFSLKKLSQLRGAEPATRRWASYVALSQLRGTEPATWHWASKVALSFELARRQWASKIALSFIIYIYIPMQSQAYNILNLGQNNFFEGDTYLWAGAGMWNLPFDYKKLDDHYSNVSIENASGNNKISVHHANEQQLANSSTTSSFIDSFWILNVENLILWFPNWRW